MTTNTAKVNRNTLPNILFFLIHLCAYSYFFNFTDWNSTSRFDLTLAMVERGTVSIDSYHDAPGWQTGDKAFYNGHFYSDKAPGASFLGALVYLPVYRLTKLAGIVLEPYLTKIMITIGSIALPSAAAALLALLVAQQIAGNGNTAFLATIAITLGSMFWPFSTTFMGHPLTGALIFASFFLGFHFYSTGRYPNRIHLIVIGLLMGFAFITEYTIAVVIVWVLGYLLLKASQHGRFIESFLLIGLGSVITIIPALIYNMQAFNNPLASGYKYLLDRSFIAGMTQGIMGIGWPRWRVILYMTIHPSQGILWGSPVLLLLAPAFFRVFTSKFKTEMVMVLGIISTLLIIVSGYYMWWGGWSFAPRHLTTMMLFLVIPLATTSPKMKPFLLLGTLVSVLEMFVVVATTTFVSDHWARTVSLRNPFGSSTLYSVLLIFLDGKLTDNLGKFFIPGQFLSLLPFILVEGLLFLSYWSACKDSFSGLLARIIKRP